MLVDRRTFLLGATATALAASVKAYKPFVGDVTTGVLNPNIPFRAIHDLCFSCMPTGEEIKSPGFREEPIRYSFYRGENRFLHIMLNPRAAFRWVPSADAEVIINGTDTLRLVVEPSWTYMSLNIMSYTSHRQSISESFLWRDGKVESSDIASNDYRFKIPNEWRT